MTSRLTRYIVSHILGLTAIVALGLVAIQAFVTFVAQLDEVRAGFGYFQLLQYVGYLVPNALYMMLPIIAMLGTLLGLGTLAGQSELIAMRAAGVSLMRIGGATLTAGVLLGGLAVLLGDFLAPQGDRAAEMLRSEAHSGVKAGVNSKAVWLREGEHVFQIQRLLAEDHFESAEIYTLGPDLNLAAVTHVDDGVYRDKSWHFSGVRRTEFGAASARLVTTPTLEWPGTLSPEVLKLVVLESSALSSAGLIRLIDYLQANNLDTRSYSLALARKIMAPFTVMAMMLFAIPFVLGSLRTAGAGARLFVGVLVGLAFYVINEVTANTGQLYGWNPLLSAGAPTFAFAAFGLLRLAQNR